uniref:Pecanex-like protein n=1 Tax=Macrostomum lignano TaxID=282301 RepID=A0A1I8F9M5_9PLAT
LQKKMTVDVSKQKLPPEDADFNADLLRETVNLLVFWLQSRSGGSLLLICTSRGILHFFALFRLLSEMSTPFLNVVINDDGVKISSCLSVLISALAALSLGEHSVLRLCATAAQTLLLMAMLATIRRAHVTTLNANRAIVFCINGALD